MSWTEASIDRIYRAVGSRVRDARTEAKLTQLELARRAGVTRSTIANFEAGRQRIPLHLFVIISSTLGIHSSELLADSDLGLPGPSLSPEVQMALGDAHSSSQDFVRETLAVVNILDES
jgi:transcriptional regulator with XRE-family HTH domain